MDRTLALWRRAGAEALAAFALVFAGCGAIIANQHYDGALGSVGVSLVFGLIIMVMVYATGHLSGAHINPSVTIAFTLTRHFSPRDAIAYIAAQLTGATLAALVLLGYAANTDIRHLATAVYDSDHSPQSRSLLEAYRASDYFALNDYVQSESELARLMDSGAVRAGIIIPPHYGDDLIKGRQAQGTVDPADYETLRARIMRDLLESPGDGRDSRSLLSACYTGLGGLGNDSARSRDYYRQARELREAIHKTDPGKAHSRNDLGESLFNLARNAYRSGRADEAETLYQRCLALLEPFATDNAAVIGQPAAALGRAGNAWGQCRTSWQNAWRARRRSIYDFSASAQQLPAVQAGVVHRCRFARRHRRRRLSGLARQRAQLGAAPVRAGFDLLCCGRRSVLRRSAWRTLADYRGIEAAG